MMEIEFDPRKGEQNRAGRGFGFSDAARVFLDRPISYQDDRTDYDEVRMIAIGEIEGRLHGVYTDRGDVRRIISARRASRQENRRWPSSE